MRRILRELPDVEMLLRRPPSLIAGCIPAPAPIRTGSPATTWTLPTASVSRKIAGRGRRFLLDCSVVGVKGFHPAGTAV